MQAAAQKPSLAGALRAAFHSFYPPDTAVFRATEELEELLLEHNISYRKHGDSGLLLININVLQEKIPELQEFLSQQKAAAEAQHRRIKTSNRNKGSSNDSSGERERLYPGGGVAYSTTVPPPMSYYNVLEKLLKSEGLRVLAQKRGNPNRMHTSIKIDRDIWARFKLYTTRHGLRISEVLEDLILLFLEVAQDATSGTE